MVEVCSPQELLIHLPFFTARTLTLMRDEVCFSYVWVRIIYSVPVAAFLFTKYIVIFNFFNYIF